MSDLVPESHFDGIVRIVKLTNGEELLGIVRDATPDRIQIILPAKVESAFSRDEKGNPVEYVKLTNYAANVQNFEITINRNSILYIGVPIPQLNKMYDAFFIAMKSDPHTIVTNGNGDVIVGPEAGLQMLNELFNNEDFINFINDLVDSFEGENVLNELFDEEEVNEADIEIEPESPINDLSEEPAPEPPKRKKRRKIKPTTNDIPFNPESNPNSAEGWSDNPQDYI